MHMTQNKTRRIALSIAVVAGVSLLSACADKPGSKGWCEDMSAKSKGEWTTQEVADYAKYCLVDQATQ